MMVLWSRFFWSKRRTLPSAPTLENRLSMVAENAMSYTARSCAMSWVSIFCFSRFQIVHVVSTDMQGPWVVSMAGCGIGKWKCTKSWHLIEVPT